MGVIDQAARAVADASAFVFCAGAGMGVDSGLPDFRGPEGFWNAYPPFRKLGLDFYDLANPRWFRDDPSLAWGFYGHRTNLYRETEPHSGFAEMLQWCADRPAFVFTSNVDGGFQKAGFGADAVCEVHGSIHHLQCAGPCSDRIWDGRDAVITVDPVSCRAAEPLPLCPQCGALARPNILMFGDGQWVDRRSDAQHDRFHEFLRREAGGSLVVVECGAGTAVPTVRYASERLLRGGAALVRINPREAEGPAGTISVPMGAAEAIAAIAAAH